MQITIIGSGYVGLVSGICFAKIGHQVCCVDKDASKISSLKNGEIPIFEPGLKELLKEVTTDGNISFTTSLEEGLKDSAAVFIAVGTPQGENGSADMSYVLAATKEIAEISAKNSVSKLLIVTKSTVPVGTGDKIKKLVQEIAPQVNFSVASNPEFLREGAAIGDFMEPDRIVVGVENEFSKEIFQRIYANFAKEKLVVTDIKTAEMIKYASNSFLATKIAFINEMADLCEKTGANIKQLARAIGLDSRIGEKFLNPGPGFGGSCFPKDIMAILKIAEENDTNLSLINQVIKSNNQRKLTLSQRVISEIGSGKKIALLGLAFKANTDDIRYSPAIAIAKELLKKGIEINATDPEAIENSKAELAEFSNIKFFNDIYETVSDVDLVVVATEWKEYSNLDLEKISNLVKSKKILDLRNLLDVKKVEEAGFEYGFIGKKKINND